ncbi:MAG: hypothetical protein PF551_00190, partial [Candidatus Marinimicrobia bacterium]|nr:hypothetical protein [Candidatus Neomarinimicrobiota bacterium]
MKKVIVLLISVFVLAGFAWGQSSPGDIAFIAANADGDDDFAFVTLVNIPASTSIYFTDNEWNGTAFNDLGEGEITWTNGASQLDAGSVVVFTDPINGGGSVNVGSHSGNGWNLNASNEWIYALLEAPAISYVTPPTFLAAMATDAGSGWLTGTGLTQGTNAIDFNDDNDGYKYTGSISGESSFANYLPLIMNASNWQIETSDGELILPISTTAFTVAGTPLITLSESSLTNFTYVVGNGPSAEQSFTAQGSNLTNDIILTAPTNYEISLDNVSYQLTPITLTQSGGVVASTTIYTRLKIGLSVGDYDENITATSTDATNKTVTCSGTVLNVEPTSHVTDFTATAVGHNKIDLSWTDATGETLPDDYLIKASSTGYDDITAPSDGTPEADDTDLSDGSGTVNVNYGIESYSWMGLSELTTYYFKIYPYTNSGDDIDYKTGGTVPQVFATTEAAPELPNIWINEFHYDNESTDEGEFVEIVAPADFTELSSIRLTLYRDVGTTYDTYTLDEFTTNGNTYWGFKIYYNDIISGIQNGSKDGFSLDYNSNVIQFLSYEGSFTATEGPANGMASTDIGVSEGSSTPVGHSLQLIGNGTQYSDFTWSGPCLNTKELPNSCDGQDQSLPVTLMNFNANSENGNVVLTWTTASESDNLGYKIYRKSDDE